MSNLIKNLTCSKDNKGQLIDVELKIKKDKKTDDVLKEINKINMKEINV